MASRREAQKKNNTQRLKAQYIHVNSTILIPLIYRHTCNMADKTHRNFAFRSTFFPFIWLLFVYGCVYAYKRTHMRASEPVCALLPRHTNTIPHRSAKIATNMRKTKKRADAQQKKNIRKERKNVDNGTRFENAKAMCPLRLYNTIVVKRTNNREKNNITTLPERKRHSFTHSHTHTKTFKSRKIEKMRKRERNRVLKNVSWRTEKVFISFRPFGKRYTFCSCFILAFSFHFLLTWPLSLSSQQAQQSREEKN